MKYPCPCCGYLTFNETDSYDICPVCGWEDDVSQLRFPKMGGGANKDSLIDTQKTAKIKSEVAQKYSREAGWRPLDPLIDNIEEPISGEDYGSSYPDDITKLYYWRTD